MDLSVAKTKVVMYLSAVTGLDTEALRTLFKALGDAEASLDEARQERDGIYEEANRVRDLMGPDGFAPFTPRGVVMVLVDKLQNALATIKTQRGLQMAQDDLANAKTLLAATEAEHDRARAITVEVREKQQAQIDLANTRTLLAATEAGRAKYKKLAQDQAVALAHECYVRQEAQKEVERLRHSLDLANEAIERLSSRPVELRGLDGFTLQMRVTGCEHEILLPPPYTLSVEVNPRPTIPNRQLRVFKRRHDLDAPGGPAVYVEVR